MRFPISLYLSMTGYLLKMKMKGQSRYPLVLMLEPTHRCNLSCAGCGRIREYHDTLDQEMSVQQCLRAVDEAGTPVVTITGGEPLMYSGIVELVEKVLSRKKHIYLCTNGLLLQEALTRFRPNPRFTWNLHFDGTEQVHDTITGRRGAFQRSMSGLREAKRQGFRVSTNTTVYRETDLQDVEALFEQLSAAGVDGILVAPGFGYQEVERDVFLSRREIMDKFRTIRSWSRRFPLISNPIYLDFVAGYRDLRCTPWGNPTCNPQGWKSPCYLITDAHYPTYKAFMQSTNWDYYRAGKDPRCAQCMVHCGYEPTVVCEMTLKDLVRMAEWNLHD